MQRRWILPPESDSEPARRLARDLGIPPFVARVLLQRMTVDTELDEFLHPRLRSLSDPNLLPEMPAAIARLELALRRREKIVLYGDYDVDGVTSLALLHRVLSAHGAESACFLPLRAEEGYGLSAAGVERCLEEHRPDLLVAVDCGTNSRAEVAALRARGVDVIILDHHEPEGDRPDCTARVNPKCGDGEFAYLCSVGIAFKAAHALLKSSPLPDFDLKHVLDIVALGTVADLVPLEKENRILVRAGLQQMAATRWTGLAALMRVAGVQPPVRASDVGFRLGPRINASGRLGTAQESLRLLLTNDFQEASRLASSLDRQNRERQNVEQAVAREVEQWIDDYFEPGRHASIVAGARDWHHGVLGIVASRVTRRHPRPVIVVGFNDSGEGKGSGRSIEGLCLVTALSRCAGHLLRYGGHEMAAGLSIHENQLEEFRNAFEAAARAMVDDEMLVPSLRLHAELPLHEFGEDVLEAQQSLEPFGTGNPQPILFARGLAPLAAPKVLKEKHLRFDFPAGRQRIQAIFFNGAAHDLPRPPWDVAYLVERNEFNGRVSAQMQIVDIRSAA
ncbi:MAG: single-stranded-DNA-specific exonuclease RecJ [Terrimicrobiaceae bacterium]|nr:single-stranded-DNA-specific exonuclease RecJ [Terrimicrobiaceae bacterium]